MITTRKLVSLGVGAAVAVLFSGAAAAQLPKEDQKCIDQYNNKLRLVSAQAGKSATKCAQNAAKGKEPDANNCIVNNTDGKIAGKESKVTALFGTKCLGGEPIQQGAATGNAAHRNALTEFARDLYGTPIVVIQYSKQSSKCIQKATQRPTQAFTEWVKGHRKCKKDLMKAGTVETSADLDNLCGTVAQADPKLKIQKKIDKSTADITANCATTEESLPTLFPGLDGACHADENALAACINARAFCRACEALNTADGQDMDCDAIDDGLANGSCGGFPAIDIGSHACTMNNGGGTSLALFTQALPLNLNASGSLQIDCGTTTPDGKAACDCNINSFDPVVIPSIGDVCVNPAAGCASGEVDCDGGNAMDNDLKADHNIGACASNAGCSTSCDAFCGGFGVTYTQIASGCEGFCLGGGNDEAACTQDTECPGGSCVGANPPAHAGICNCVCSGTGLGAPSAAGSLACNVGVQINVELPSNGTCGDPATIVLAPQCGAMTTTTATGQINNANNTPAKLAPPAVSTLNGTSVSCAALEASTTTGISLVGSLGFFDSTLGDIHSGNTFVCN